MQPADREEFLRATTLAEVDLFLATTRTMSASRLGQIAAHDSALVGQLRSGRPVQTRLLNRLRMVIACWPFRAPAYEPRGGNR